MQSHCFSVLNKNGIVPEAKMKHTYKKKKKKKPTRGGTERINRTNLKTMKTNLMCSRRVVI